MLDVVVVDEGNGSSVGETRVLEGGVSAMLGPVNSSSAKNGASRLAGG